MDALLVALSVLLVLALLSMLAAAGLLKTYETKDSEVQGARQDSKIVGIFSGVIALIAAMIVATVGDEHSALTATYFAIALIAALIFGWWILHYSLIKKYMKLRFAEEKSRKVP